MFSSTFIFGKRQYDDEFHRLDQEIAEAARATPGYLGEESWESAATGLISNVYYWESLEALQALIKHPRHLEAKSRQENWLAGYQVVISQVLRIYGDAKLDGLLAVTRSP
jgi:heme-degrading monooxygenase HmoA